MIVRFYIAGEHVLGVDDDELRRTLDQVFNRLSICPPECPRESQRVYLVKDGLEIKGTVRYVDFEYIAPGNGLVEDRDANYIYSVNLMDIELIDWDRTRYGI